jgi:hypothetical protein
VAFPSAIGSIDRPSKAAQSTTTGIIGDIQDEEEEGATYHYHNNNHQTSTISQRTISVTN